MLCLQDRLSVAVISQGYYKALTTLNWCDTKLPNAIKGYYHQGMVRMKNGMERKFWYEIWKMPEWNGRFQVWNGRQSSILPYQFFTRFSALYSQKNIHLYMDVR